MSKSGQKEFVESLLYALTAPIIIWPGHEDMIDKRLVDKSHLYRLTDIADIEKRQATDFEVALYLMTASLVSPLGRAEYQIYKHVFSKYFPGHVTPDELELTEKMELDKLKSWLYKKQMQHIQEKSKAKTLD